MPPAAEAATPRRDAVRHRAEARKRRGRRRTYLIAGGVVLAIVAAIVASRVLGGQEIAELNELAAANGCSELEVTSESGASQHLPEGGTAEYDTIPPTHGEHAVSSLPAGVYEEPFSENPTDQSTIYKAVHSLEHGYILVWHEGLDDDAQRELESTYRGERKVIVVPYEGLEGDTTVAMTAWGRVLRCEEPAPDVIDAFIDLFREARSAPEPNAA